LQEQLFHKDLPRLAKIIPDLHFELLKGRGRYVCESRLEGVVNDVAQDSLLGDDSQGSFAGASWQSHNDASAPRGPRDATQAMRWFTKVAKALRSGKWDGDMDSLERQPDPQDWRMVHTNLRSID